MMIETIDFHMKIINHLSEHYQKLHPTILQYYEAGYNSTFRYCNNIHSPEFGANLRCDIVLGPTNAWVCYKSDRFYKAQDVTLVNMSLTEPVSNVCSNFSGYSLDARPNHEEAHYLLKSNNPTKIIGMLDEFDDDDLEAMEFQLLTKYDLCETTAILLYQHLLMKKNFQRFVLPVPPFVGLEEEKKAALLDIYFSTATGLEHETGKVR